jgi:glycosyltransferase involved in cell wall biosynthesis
LELEAAQARRDPPRLSVIVSTFERPDALRLALEGYARSRFRDFEVIVADDGSADGTGALVAELASASPYPLSRVWQPHEGFRLAAARNLAVRAARGSVLAFADGDCIPLDGSLESLALRCEPGRAVTGDRCILARDETERLLARVDRVEDTTIVATRRELPRLRRLRWKNRLYGFTRWKPRPKLVAANAAVHRIDFERVNGFDERFVGWGYEDEDFARRLRWTGVRIVDAALESLVLHLFHPVHVSHRPDARGSANYAYFKKGEALTRPIRGFRSRAVEELSLEFLGAVPPALRGLPEPPRSMRPEVSVVFGEHRFFGPRPRGEVVIRVGPDDSVTSPDSLYQLLRRGL